MANRTLTIIKPDSVRKRNFGKILSRVEAEGFTILAIKKINLSQKQAEGFYAVHRERPFFRDLVKYMMSGPVYVAALERKDAVAALRKLMGATDPKKPTKGRFAQSSANRSNRTPFTGRIPTRMLASRSTSFSRNRN